LVLFWGKITSLICCLDLNEGLTVFFFPPVLIIGKGLAALNWRKQLMRHATAFKMKAKKFPAEAKTQMARERRGKKQPKYNHVPPQG
jgi:hypothetical protein